MPGFGIKEFFCPGHFLSSEVHFALNDCSLETRKISMVPIILFDDVGGNLVFSVFPNKVLCSNSPLQHLYLLNDIAYQYLL